MLNFTLFIVAVNLNVKIVDVNFGPRILEQMVEFYTFYSMYKDGDAN